MHHSYNFLSQSLRASIVQLGNKNYCSERELREHILCFEKVFPHEGITNSVYLIHFQREICTIFEFSQIVEIV